MSNKFPTFTYNFVQRGYGSQLTYNMDNRADIFDILVELDNLESLVTSDTTYQIANTLLNEIS